MSKYDYPNWHEIKDLVMIYREYEWDNAEVVVWDPERQKRMRLFNNLILIISYRFTKAL